MSIILTVWTVSLLAAQNEAPAVMTQPAAPKAVKQSSVFQKRNDRVRHALIHFSVPTHHNASVAPNTSPTELYEKQVIRGMAGPLADQASFGAGLALFAAMTVIVARAPEPIRALFDGPARIGPALLRDGGLGAGVGYRW